MAKADRIPSAWPLLMSDEMAASFLDFSVSMFRKLVDDEVLPKGTIIPKTTLVRWRREDLENAARLIFGLPAKSIDLASSTGSEWLEALRAN
jgi:hypothetical protein